MWNRPDVLQDSNVFLFTDNDIQEERTLTIVSRL